jgi:periplasmic protein TonB
MNELAERQARLPAAFAAHWGASKLRPGIASTRGTAMAVSLVVHVAALLLAAAAWQPKARVDEPPAPRVRLTAPRRPKLPSAPAAPAPAPVAAPLPAVPPKRLVPPRPAAEPLPKSEPEPEPVSAAVEHIPADAGAAVTGESVNVASPAIGDGIAGALGEGLPAGAVEPPPVLSPERRQMMLASYLQEIFRSRIAARFRYPEEAERLGMEGLVVVRASVLATGALWSAQTLGDCPHRILCAAAESTVRAAAPFPPPPAGLGGAISIDVPLNYRLE